MKEKLTLQELLEKPYVLVVGTHGHAQALIDKMNNYKDIKIANLEDENKVKALEIIKVLFKGRAKLYTRDDGIEKTIDKNGNYKKAPIGLYILEFWVGDNHYEFHLHREEYDLLKEVLV